MNTQKKTQSYLKRKRRTNAIIKSSNPEHRCIVSRSLKHIQAQIIDRNGHIVVALGDFHLSSGTKQEKSFLVGKELAKKMIDLGISRCVFDRNGFLYHGRIKSLCEGMREVGLLV